MLVLDLRWLIFGLLLVLMVTAAVVVWLDRRRRRRTPLSMGEMLPVLERAPFGWLVLDKDLICHYANPYARRLLGLSSPSGPLPDEEWVYLLDDDRATAQGGDTAGRYRNVSLPSKQVVRWWIIPGDELTTVFLLDVTAQQRAEQAARSLISDLSHELRTPIATILTHLEVLSLPNISEEISQQSLRLLKEESRRMARLVNDMLEFGRLETSTEVESCPVDLLSLVEETIAQVAPQAEERQMALSLEADTPLPPVIGDPDRLRRVFLNLLDNAVKFSRPGDRVVVSLRREEQGIECAVCDSGPGIPAEHLPHVTRRFYRVEPEKTEGSGLGLALVEEILRRHQSHLEIESRTEGEETGTCARFILPLMEANEE
ncbi:MAG: ATP-binding protein [Anaerolineae bacterium]|jgi:two-component system phosphate regulon sensor histidine kinase PhoR|nr:ATP-binding protein [Anaerolineae bacterium]